MPTHDDRIRELERWRKEVVDETLSDHRKKIEDLTSWIEEEKGLTELQGKRIELAHERIDLAEQAEAIYAGRIRSLMPDLAPPTPPKRPRRSKK